MGYKTREGTRWQVNGRRRRREGENRSQMHAQKHRALTLSEKETVPYSGKLPLKMFSDQKQHSSGAQAPALGFTSHRTVGTFLPFNFSSFLFSIKKED